MILNMLRCVVLSLLFCSFGEAANVVLTWNANTEADLAGYRLFYGTASRSYGAPIQIGKQTTYTVTGLNAGTYYFGLKAVDTSGNESGFSNEAVKIVSASPPPPQTVCADGLDNDGDAKIDLADPGCVNALDTNEVDATPPSQGLTITNLTPANYLTASLIVGSAIYWDTGVYTLTAVPSILTGGLWIKTRHGDRFNTSTGVSFTVNQSVNVYVGYNAQASVLPAWLASGWINTGAQISTSGGARKVYSKAFPSGGISLGANSATPAASSSPSMYTITVSSGAPVPPPPPPGAGSAVILTGPANRTLSVTRRADNNTSTLPLTVNKDDCLTFNGAKIAGGLNCP